MKTLGIFIITMILGTSLSFAGGYEVGDKATDFSLKNVDGRNVSLADFDDAKGFIVVFTCNHCPYSVKYEDRILALDAMYKDKGYPVIAINPNDPARQPEDSFELMKERAKEKKFTFPYLVDETQEYALAYGAARTPHVFVLKREGSDLIVKYIGAIDNNAKSAELANEKYIENALDALLAGNDPEVNYTKALGCTIKWKE
ncbi:MAG TPA: thioredoxin family protein [Bacteroidales bacterium]|nr:thioredoxin family protein [Bacteroidales bacterium]